MSAVTKLNELELQRGVPDSASWHNDYKDTSWVKVLGLAPELTEGDVICVFSQFGEIEDIELIRDPNTGRSRGLCFIKYEQFKSAWLTVDNFNEAILLDRTLRVDHHRATFRRKKQHEGMSLEDLLKEVRPGHAYENKEVAGSHSINKGMDVYASRGEQVSSWKADAARSGTSSSSADPTKFAMIEAESDDERATSSSKKHKKEKKERKEKKKKHKKHKHDSDVDSDR